MIPRALLRLRRTRDDQGFSLIEMMIVLVAFSVLMAMTVPIVSTVFQTSSRVNLTYTNLNDQLWLSTNLQRLLRAAVAPAPSYDGTTPVSPPVPPFELGGITPTSLTFFANTGTANGPEEVTASCTQTPSKTTLCAPTATFTLMLTPAEPTTCPFSETTTTKHCTWPSTSSRRLLSIPHVVNGDSSSATPLFTYEYKTTTVCSAGTPTGCSGSATVTFASAKCRPNATSTTSEPFATCPAGEIDTIYYDLEFNVKVTKITTSKTTAQNGGFQTKTVSGTTVMASTTVLYSPAVG
ncbi:MAG TPA: prepilin-type N-terminal cleavage/methylation domain-containing protein [Acidimicrobiales bacterium]|nr:prepilin-type N-terminal cleavage/methylation domain-containing protein [Acidimicrobiales bacterium]